MNGNTNFKMLDNWLRPIDLNLVKELELDKSRFGTKILRYEDALPDLKNVAIALIGVGEEDANALRRQLYPMSFSFGKMKIADLGNVRREEVSFIIPVIRELLAGGICPLIIGREGRLVQAQFEAHHSWQAAVSLAVVDEKIAFHPQLSEARGYYLNSILNNKSRLFHFAALGCQSHFTDEAVFQELEQRNFDCIRLGKARGSLPDTEPFVRDADMVAFYLSALKKIEAPGVTETSPSGFFTEEACQLSRYAGMSDKLTSIGFYGFQKKLDREEQTAQALAQLVWYFIDGFCHRQSDFPASMNDLVEYIVDLKGHDQQVTFWKSNKTGRWWVQAPVKTKKKHERHRLLPCSYNDYLSACNDDLPERLMAGFQRFS